MVHNLIYSGLYPRITLSNYLIQRIITLVPLTVTELEVYLVTMNNFIYDFYESLEEAMDHLNSIKLNGYYGENVSV